MKSRLDLPTATYRLQFHSDFKLADARALLPYLRRLGISTVYASPIFKAVPGSKHGYDVCDHNALNPEVGSEQEFEEFAAELKAQDLGLIVDFVPNHMGIGEPQNAWWLDVLENGPSSQYARYFDIDWQPLKRELGNKVLLPILGDQYGRVLARGELKLAYENGAFFVHYYNNILPVAARTTRPILQRTLEIANSKIDEEARTELQSILTALFYLPPRDEPSPEKIVERTREQGVIKRRLRVLVESSSAISEALQAAIEEMQHLDKPESLNAFDAFLNAQSYRLSFWRVAGEEINYRRFFDINTLAAIRMEQPEVFEETHQLIFSWIAQGIVTGMRIDHIDGLWDPRQYLEQLQERYAQVRPEGAPEQLYIAVEKILGHEERLRTDWPVAGTTGYEFANELTALLIDKSAEKAITETYRNFTDQHLRFDWIAYQSKLLVMRTAMSSEVNVLGHMLNRISETNRWYRDFTLNALTAALREIIACFPVYRTYIRAGETPSDDDRRVILRAIDTARRRNPALERSVFDFLRETLLPAPGDPHALDDTERLRFVAKFQQCSGPITAKGVEDTAFYVYNRLVALNEVGGEPGQFGSPVETFHEHNSLRQRDLPACMLATSTHDTKRSEDVRARLTAISEISQEWAETVRRWNALNRSHKRRGDQEDAPDANEEYLLYQTLLASWPLEAMDDAALEDYTARIQLYMEKAIREAKVHTSWIEPDQHWEDAVRDFVSAILSRAKSAEFLEELQTLAKKIAEIGAINSLSQVLLKCTTPGAPDFYQGNEIWDFSLVDPDNRRPVDYALRAKLLDQVEGGIDPGELLEHWRDGRIKLYLTQRLLCLRRERRDLFLKGSYRPVVATGEHASSVVAFTRSHGSQTILVVAPRLSSRVGFPAVGSVWGDTAISTTGRWRNIFTGAEIHASPAALTDVFNVVPFAVFEAI